MRCARPAKPLIKGDFEKGWRTALHAGWIDGTALRQDGGGAPGASFKAHSSRADVEGFAGDHLPSRSRTSTTAAGRTLAGCRNCPSR